jgi:hypothetical protein
MDWQPIETAPKDARIVLVVHKSGKMSLMRADELRLPLPYYVRNATHWMPLPEPPA